MCIDHAAKDNPMYGSVQSRNISTGRKTNAILLGKMTKGLSFYDAFIVYSYELAAC